MMSRRQRLVLGTVAIAVCEAITLGVTIGASHRSHDARGIDVIAILLLAVPPLTLPLRLKYPVHILAFTLACTIAYTLVGYPGGPIFLALGTAYFTAHRLGHRRWAIASLVTGYFAIGWLPALVDSPGNDGLGWGPALGLLAWLLVLFAIGEVVRTRARYAEEFERAREEEASRQISDERLRIARELHDVLAHNVSLINVQAGVALHLIDQKPEQAREALTNIKAASAETLREMRSVLGILRGVDEEAPRSPAPSIDRLDTLIGSASAAGLAVTKEVEGAPAHLPAGVDLAAYRIVQEALTNVTRHAGQSAHATIRLDYGDDSLTVQVDDDGRGADALSNGDSPGAGAGIRGMHERVAALGGSLEARPRPGGGFRVRAVLPLDGVS